MNASPMAWISAAISILSLAGMIYSGIFAYAGLHADIKTLQSEMKRNFEDDKARNEHGHRMIDKNHEFTVKSVERIDTTISGFSTLNVKIGVLETKLESLIDVLKRIERQMERTERAAHHKQPAK